MVDDGLNYLTPQDYWVLDGYARLEVREKEAQQREEHLIAWQRSLEAREQAVPLEVPPTVEEYAANLKAWDAGIDERLKEVTRREQDVAYVTSRQNEQRLEEQRKRLNDWEVDLRERELFLEGRRARLEAEKHVVRVRMQLLNLPTEEE